MFWIDHRVLEALANRRVSVIDRFARAASELDRTGMAMLVTAAIIVSALVAWRQWRAVVSVTLAVLVAQGLTTVLKDVIAEPRPPRHMMLVLASGWAMPSSHAAYSAAAAVALVLAVRWTSDVWRLVAAAMLAMAAASVGFLMVYAGVHWLSDVLIGWMLGVAVGVGVNALTRVVVRRPAPT